MSNRCLIKERFKTTATGPVLWYADEGHYGRTGHSCTTFYIRLQFLLKYTFLFLSSFIWNLLSVVENCHLNSNNPASPPPPPLPHSPAPTPLQVDTGMGQGKLKCMMVTTILPTRSYILGINSPSLAWFESITSICDCEEVWGHALLILINSCCRRTFNVSHHILSQLPRLSPTYIILHLCHWLKTCVWWKGGSRKGSLGWYGEYPLQHEERLTFDRWLFSWPHHRPDCCIYDRLPI